MRSKQDQRGTGGGAVGRGAHARRLYLIDASGLLFRAYFAFIRRPLTTSKGRQVGALLGFLNTLLALIRREGAEHLAVAFDSKGPTFRHERYGAYKANRPETPPELVDQISLARRLVKVMGLSCMAQEGVEADDLIGSMVQRTKAAGWEAVIVSADKDFSQLIGPGVLQYVPSRGREPSRWLDADAVTEKWGVRPDQFIDYMALTGDASDNIPGVKGVGPKTAAALLQKHGSLDAIYKDLESVTPPVTRKKLESGRQDAFLSRDLIRLRTDLLDLDPAALSVPDPAGRKALREFLEEMEFRTLVKRIFQGDAVEAENATMQALPLDQPGAGSSAGQLSLHAAPEAEGGFIQDGAVAVRDGWAQRYELIESLEALDRALTAFPHRKGGRALIAIDTETSGLDPLESELVGLSFAWEPGRAWYIPLGHKDRENLALDGVRQRLDRLLSDQSVSKVGQNLKFDLHLLQRHGFRVKGPFLDTMVASYLRDPGARHGLDALARELLGHDMVPIEVLIGRGKGEISMTDVPAEKVAPYACEDVDAALRLFPLLEKQLRAMGAWDLFRDVEMPLLPVLAGMERAGIGLDTALLEAMGESLVGELRRCEDEVYRLAGESFNINSPKQLQPILFKKLKLKPRRRTKTGYSTGQEVLEQLAALHPLPGKILEYRQLTKLRSTYVEALPRMVNPRTGRIHATFHQTVTATGRLSSSNPNLQNIPIRTPLGREIRKAFVAPSGRSFLSADYSQIELRLLAHLSEDEYLVQAFRQGADIHRATAARVFGVSESEVDPQMRSRAKVVNFGILYGMGAQRLSREQGIPVKEASRFIAEYFEKLPGVKVYIDRCVSEARSRGYAETILGRRRYLPDLQSQRHQVRAGAERMAVNTPVQGSAADLIKLAMVRLQQRLEQDHTDVRLLIQVHDELVFEVPDDEVEALARLVAGEMAAVMSLRVPLGVETGSGKNWCAAHV